MEQDGLGDELAAFEAELSKLESAPAEEPEPKLVASAGPRAPKVISAAPMRSAPPTSSSTIPVKSATQSQRSSAEDQQSASTSEQRDADAAESSAPPQTVSTSDDTTLQVVPATSVPPPSSSSQVVSSYNQQAGSSAVAERPASSAAVAAVAPISIKSEKALAKQRASVVKRTVAGTTWQDKSMLEWPEDDFRIFVGDLGNETNDDVLAHAFSKYPSMQKAKVIRDKSSGKSRGFGFISFKDPWDMTKSLREMQGKYIGNRPVKVRKSTWKERAMDTGTSTKEHSQFNHSLAISEKRLRKGLSVGPAMSHSGGFTANKKQKKKQKGMPW